MECILVEQKVNYEEKENRMFWKILVLILKIIFAIPAVLLFALVRVFSFF